MNKLRRSINIGFWSIFLAIPLLVSLVRGTDADNAEVVVLFLIGVGLTAIAFSLRNKPIYQFRWNAACAALFLILYGLIGYPNLRRPGGEIPIGPAILLVLLGFVPLVIFISAKTP
jgi:hypothetical protein